MQHWLSRRSFLRQAVVAGGAGWITNSVWADDELGEANGPKVVRVSVEMPNLPPGLDGFRIAQVSDLHLEPYTRPRHIMRMVDACNGLEPDLVAMTGDFVTYDAKPAGQLAAMLAQIKSRHGSYACLGNHDFQSGHEKVVTALTQEGIPVLRNESVQIHADRGSFTLAGLDSRYIGSSNLKGALAEWKPGQPLVMLQHEPDVADDLAEMKVPALQLSGHTHGGQLRFLGMTPSVYRRARFGKKYLAGAYNVGPVKLYVNRGIGCVGVPLRVKCPPEITEITLRSPKVAV